MRGKGTRQAFDIAELSVFKLHPRKLEAPLRPAQFGTAIELTGGLMEVDEIVSGDVAPFILRFSRPAGAGPRLPRVAAPGRLGRPADRQGLRPPRGSADRRADEPLGTQPRGRDPPGPLAAYWPRTGNV